LRLWFEKIISQGMSEKQSTTDKPSKLLIWGTALMLGLIIMYLRYH
jgi:hypothetical protein